MRSRHFRVTSAGCVLIFLGSAISGFAIPPKQPLSSLSVQRWGQESGIPEETITAITFSTDGYLWASSLNGLIRFDGRRARVFYPGRLTSCPDNTLMGVVRTPDGQIWAGSTRGCVFRFHTDRFDTFANPRISSELVPSVPKRPSGDNTIVALQLRSPEPKASTAPDAMGLEIVRPGGIGPVQTLTASRNGGGAAGRTSEYGLGNVIALPAGLTLRAATRSKLDSALWAYLSDGSVYRQRPGTGVWDSKFAIPHRQPPGQYRTMVVTASPRPDGSAEAETVWVTSGKGLIRWRDGRILGFGDGTGLSTDDIFPLIEDRHGCLWTGVNGGVARICGDTVDSRRLWTQGEDQAQRLAEDAEGNIWVAGRWGMLMRLSSPQFTVLTKADGLPESRCTGVTVDARGDLWVSSRERGLSRVVDGRVVQTFPVPEGVNILTLAPLQPSLGGGVLLSSSDGLHVASQDGGLRPVQAIEGGAGGRRIPATAQGTLYALGGGEYLYSEPNVNWRLRLPPGGFTGQMLAEPLAGPPQIRQWARMLARSPGAGLEKQQQAVWAISYYEGLYQLAGPAYVPAPAKVHSKPERWLSLYADSGILWIGTTDGLMAYSTVENRYLPRAAMREDQIFHITGDDGGHLWVSTRAGLVRLVRSEVLDWVTGKGGPVAVERFGERHGLPTLNFGLVTSASGAKTASGRIWFPGIRGLVGVDPALIDRSMPATMPLLLQIKADQEAVDPDKPVLLPAGTRRVEFSFGLASGAQRGSDVCRYRMVGFDPDWILCQGDLSAQYTNLEPGDYEFVLQTASAVSKWDGPQLRTPVGIQASFYQTAHFKGTAILAGLGLVALLIHLRQVRLVRHNDELQERVRERTKELEAAKESAEAAVKAKGQFLATMSHEIRTPMNGVVGIAQLLRESELDEDQRELVEVIRNSGESLLSILDGVLDLAKLEAGKMTAEPKPMLVRPIVHEVADLFQARATSKGISILTEVAVDVPAAIFGDPVRIRQVLLNLVGNAVKFTEHGSVRLRVERSPALAESAAEGGEGQGRLLLLVEDTGVGVSAEDLRTLFDDFVQADSSSTRRHSGTGLGLAIVRRFAETMGGRVVAESRLGHGSRFGIDLPLVVAEPPGAPEQRLGTGLPPADDAATSSVGAWAPSLALRILVAEDNAVNRLVIRRMLERLGCEVTTAHDGLEALEVLNRHTFDAVLMDCHMPEVDGYEITRRLRARGGNFAELPIIAVTASTSAEDREKCRAAGMNDFLSKPLLLDRLRLALEAVEAKTITSPNPGGR